MAEPNDTPTQPDASPGPTPLEITLGRIEGKIDGLIKAVSDMAEPVTEIEQLRQRVSDLELDVKILKRATSDTEIPPAPASPPLQ